ncbi:hypothetical protein KKG46_05800 [Patescibacteria group bacterium]|nr:hypothetical protein [Patescibacteria group bacterium]
MKKYMPGFVPVNYNKAGKILLVIGLICSALGLTAHLADWFNLSIYVLYLGIGLILVGLYLVLFVPKEKE